MFYELKNSFACIENANFISDIFTHKHFGGVDADDAP